MAYRERVVHVRGVCHAELLMALVEMGEKLMTGKILKKDLTDPSLATELHYPV